MHTAISSSMPHPPVGRRVAVVALAVATADQIARALALGVAAGSPSDVLSLRTTRFGLGVFDSPVPMVALLAAIGIMTVGLVGVRRAQAGLLPAWVPGFLIGGAASTVIDRFAGGAVADLLPAPWSFSTLADLAIVAGVVGWILADRDHARTSRPERIRA